MNFNIDPSFLCMVTIKESGNIYLEKSDHTEADTFEYLKGMGDWSITKSEDHPEFALLRNRLGREGFIEIQQGWVNGDRVLKEFFLNGARFRAGEKFCCASAIKYDIEFKLKSNNIYCSF